MASNEQVTRRELIDPALLAAGWQWDREVLVGPGRVNVTGERMYDETQKLLVDYVLKIWNMPLATLEAKAEGSSAADGMQQSSRYAKRLGLRFSVASNGSEFILTDNATGKYETLKSPPTPEQIFGRLGLKIDFAKWRPAFEF